MTPLIAGLVAGALHVFSGPDHLAALAPLAIERPGEGARVGARWGVGHALGVLLLGGLGLLARDLVDVPAWSAMAEAIVGGTLVLVGLWAVRRAGRLVVHAHPHGPQPGGHAHLHAHWRAVDHDDPAAHRGHRHAPLAIGLLHGVAGTGHLFGVIPAMAFAPADAVVYLAVYAVAAVGAMAGFGGLLGRLTRLTGPRGLRGLMFGSGAVAVAVGGVWLGLALAG